jgi:hypothetical protein
MRLIENEGARADFDDNRGIFLAYSPGGLDFLGSSSMSDRPIGAGADLLLDGLVRSGLDRAYAFDGCWTGKEVGSCGIAVIAPTWPFGIFHSKKSGETWRSVDS